MANDIKKAISANPIKNGTTITTTSWTGSYSKYDGYVKNTPAIEDIQAKFGARFDDPSYYYGNSTQGS
jgi:hypothetical protein